MLGDPERQVSDRGEHGREEPGREETAYAVQAQADQADQAHHDGSTPGLNLRGWAPRSQSSFERVPRRRALGRPPGDPQAELARLYRYAPIYIVPDASVGRVRRTSSNATLARSQSLRNPPPSRRRYSYQLPPRPFNLRRTTSVHTTMPRNSDIRRIHQRSTQPYNRPESLPPHSWVIIRIRQYVTVDRLYYTEVPQLPRSTGLVEQPRLVIEGATTERYIQEDTSDHYIVAQSGSGEARLP